MTSNGSGRGLEQAPADATTPAAAPPTLLGPGDPHPVRLSNPDGAGPFVLVSDHPGRLSPGRLGDLGVAPADWERHIAVDIGIDGVGEGLARLLDAPLVEQRYSRLVIDCNRPPGHPTSIPALSEGTAVPANRALTGPDRERRQREILHPYHAAIAALLDRRAAAGLRSVLVALHSFTPVYTGVARPWHAAILHDPAEGNAHAGHVLAGLRQVPGLVVGDNEPYALTALSDYTVPLHAWRRALDHVEIEIRQDLLSTPAGRNEWAERFARLLAAADAETVRGNGGTRR